MSRLLVAQRALTVPGWAKDLLWTRARAVPSLDLRFADNKSLVDATTGASLVTFTRASSGTYVGSDGVLKTAVTDAPRFDHNPTTGESLGLLVEEARTNLILRSEEFDNASWGKFAASITANNAIAPNGASTADALIPNTTTTFHLCNQGFTLVNGTTYTFSIYLKAAGYNFVLLNTSTGSASGNAGPIINLSNGTKAGFLAVDYPTLIQSVGNGWYRVSYQYTSNGTFGVIDINTLPTSSISAYAGDGTSGIYIWGAQLEAGAFATSYIPTTSATVTRAADVASITGSNFSSWYNQTEGTVFAEFTPRTFAQACGLLSLDDGTTSERLQTRLSTAGNGSFLVADGGSVQANFSTTNSTVLNTKGKLATSFALNSFQACLNGELVASDTLGTLPTVTQAVIGNAVGAFIFNGPISRLTYFPTRFGSGTLQTISQP